MKQFVFYRTKWSLAKESAFCLFFLIYFIVICFRAGSNFTALYLLFPICVLWDILRMFLVFIYFKEPVIEVYSDKLILNNRLAKKVIYFDDITKLTVSYEKRVDICSWSSEYTIGPYKLPILRYLDSNYDRFYAKDIEDGALFLEVMKSSSIVDVARFQIKN